jgi:nicotinamidase-related amidase
MTTALLLVDIQNDYFPGGKMELEGSIEAGLNAKKLLAYFRDNRLPVVHIQHVSIRPGAAFFLPGTTGVEIHESVKPLPGETICEKHHINAFRETALLDYLRSNDVKRLVICGMMTHMCVDSTVRAAYDNGFECILASDACATRSLSFGDLKIPAEMVHAAFIAALGPVFAKITTTQAFLASE